MGEKFPLEVADLLDAGPMLDPKRTDFKEVMTAHVKEQLDDMGKMMLKLNNNLAKGSGLQAGDIKTLKLIMSSLKTVKDDGVDIQFTIDQLQETITYMELQGMGKVDPFRKNCLLNGLDDIGLTMQKLDAR